SVCRLGRGISERALGSAAGHELTINLQSVQKIIVPDRTIRRERLQTGRVEDRAVLEAREAPLSVGRIRYVGRGESERALRARRERAEGVIVAIDDRAIELVSAVI